MFRLCVHYVDGGTGFFACNFICASDCQAAVRRCIFTLGTPAVCTCWTCMRCMFGKTSLALFMAAIWNRASHYIFALWFLPSFSLFFLLFCLAYSQRSEIGCLPYFWTWCGLRIQNAGLKCAALVLLEIQDTKPPPQPFYGPISRTTRESRCQKRTSGLYGARED